MARYAAQTTVSVERSRAEIETVLGKYGADQFGYAHDNVRCLASIQFRANSRHVRFVLQLPLRNSREFTWSSRGKRNDNAALAAWEQACRQRWRALLLCVKAKLEAVAAKISTFEDEFMAHIVLPNGETVSAMMTPQIAHAYATGEQPNGIAGLLPAPKMSEPKVLDSKGGD